MEKRSCEPRDVVASKAGNGPHLIASKKLQTVLQPLRTDQGKTSTNRETDSSLEPLEKMQLC